MGFKERLREEIEYRGLLVKEISSALGLSNSTFLSYIDARGVVPNVETAVRIAKYLGVTVEYLVDGEETETKEIELSQAQQKKASLFSAYEKLSAHDKSVLVKIANAMSE